MHMTFWVGQFPVTCTIHGVMIPLKYGALNLF